MKMTNCGKLLKRLLMLCLCLALTAGCACAENVVEISNGTGESLDDLCALPDGRLLLGGSKKTASDTCTCARLVCVNTDGSVSWEYTGPEQDNTYRGFYGAAVLNDGTIAAMMIEEPQEGKPITIQFFTQDGKPTGKETAIDSWLVNFSLEPSFLVMGTASTEGDSTEIFDWDGNKLNSYDGLVIAGGCGSVAQGDETVLYGTRNGRAVLMKTDGLPGGMLWERTLDLQWPDTKEGQLYNAVKTEDGGYAALLMEMVDSPDDEIMYRKALVKFSADGDVEWTSREEAESDLWDDMFVYNGKIVIYDYPPTDMDKPLVLRWFDMDGKESGTTELTVKSADCPVLAGHAAEDAAQQKGMQFGRMLVFSAADGLWASAPAYTVDDRGFRDDAGTIMFKIPVL